MGVSDEVEFTIEAEFTGPRWPRPNHSNHRTSALGQSRRYGNRERLQRLVSRKKSLPSYAEVCRATFNEGEGRLDFFYDRSPSNADVQEAGLQTFKYAAPMSGFV
jgi:hypothetical protein